MVWLLIPYLTYHGMPRLNYCLMKTAHWRRRTEGYRRNARKRTIPVRARNILVACLLRQARFLTSKVRFYFISLLMIYTRLKLPNTLYHMYLLWVLRYLSSFEFCSQTRESLVPKQVARWSRRKGTTPIQARNITQAHLQRRVIFNSQEKCDVLMQIMLIPGLHYKLQFILQMLMIYTYQSCLIVTISYVYFVTASISHFIRLLQSNKRTSSPRTSSALERKIDFDDIDSARQPLSPLPYNYSDCRIQKK
jgi:hypothetical protein